jgi:hypothetical protein
MDPNLLAHSSFENEPGWTGGSSNGWIKISRGNSIFEIVKEPGHGESAQMVTATNLQDSEYAGVSQDVKVVGGRQYTAKAQVRIVALKGAKVQLWVDYLNAKNEYVGANIQDVQVVGGDYMTLSLRGTIPASAVYARYYVFVRSTSSSGSGTFLVTDSSYAYGNDENLLAHGDFHQEADWTSDTSNGWKKIYTTDSKFEIIRNFTSGGGAQRVSVKNLKTPYYAGLSQDIKVSGGKKFKAETRVKVNALSGAKVHLWVDYLNENNEYVGTSIKEIESAGEEMTLSISNTIPATAAYARFYIFIRSFTAAGSGSIVVSSASYTYSN